MLHPGWRKTQAPTHGIPGPGSWRRRSPLFGKGFLTPFVLLYMWLKLEAWIWLTVPLPFCSFVWLGFLSREILSPPQQKGENYPGRIKTHIPGPHGAREPSACRASRESIQQRFLNNSVQIKDGQEEHLCASNGLTVSWKQSYFMSQWVCCWFKKKKPFSSIRNSWNFLFFIFCIVPRTAHENSGTCHHKATNPHIMLRSLGCNQHLGSSTASSSTTFGLYY